MAGILYRLSNWIRGSANDRPTTNLSESQAIQLATAAASRELTLARPSTRDGRIVWTVSEAAMGSVLVVDIDDETGSVITVRRVGLR